MNDVSSYKPRSNGKPILAAGAPENQVQPTIAVSFDPATQHIGLVFDVTQFKTWDFVVAILEGAKQQAIQSGQMARAMAMQHQAMEQAVRAAQGSQLAQQVHKQILHG
jgi:hypothetical protein